MKRTLALLVPALFLAATPALADSQDCFPMCEAPQARPETKLNLCDHKAVREVARIDRDLKPVKDLYGIATNPTGYAIKLVDRHVVHIPAWVNYAIDPKGAITAKVMDRARHELKKQVGLEKDCSAELEAAQG